MAKNRAYTVWVGRTTGVLLTWAETEASTKGFKGAKYKGFTSIDDAEKALQEGWEKHYAVKEPAAATNADATVAINQVHVPVLAQEPEPECDYVWSDEDPLW